MTSHENPLLHKNNARVLLPRILNRDNREFARRGTQLYEHDFSLFLGFLSVWRGMEKNKTCLFF